jgi:hypothetical protein
MFLFVPIHEYFPRIYVFVFNSAGHSKFHLYVVRNYMYVHSVVMYSFLALYKVSTQSNVIN